MPNYDPLFPDGSMVQVKARHALEAFKREWKLHHPLHDEQLGAAGKTCRINRIDFYHGGDCMYELDGVPGLWHEACLDRAPGSPSLEGGG